MDKPFMGVISDWRYGTTHPNRITGTVVVYAGDEFTLKPGEIIVTSHVEQVYMENGARWVETRNSRYILI